MPNEIKVTVPVKETGLSKVEADARKAGKSIGDSLEKGFKAGEKASEGAAKKSQDAAKKIDAAFDSASKSIIADLDRIEQQAWESGRGMDREFSRSLKSMRDDLDRVRTEAARTGAGLESNIGDALRQIREDAKKTGKELDDALHESGGGSFGDMFAEQLGGGFDVGGMIEGLGGGAGGAWATAGAAAGALYADAVVEAFSQYWNQGQIGGLISAQNGGTVAEARKLGHIAGESYYDGFADSVESGGEALSAVVSNSLAGLDASAQDLQNLTDMAATATKVVGEDAAAIGRSAKQLLVTGLAGNAEQAIDLIVTATQRGANASGDLLDTITEYSTKFRDLGLNGQEAMGLISQALKAGARDSDTAADALKELSVRVTDGTAARGLQAIGLSADTMRQQVAAGGQSAHDALRQILNGLNSIEDPATRDQAALDLFGTKAEDLGDSLYAMDLDTATDQMKGFAGSTQGVADTLKATESPMTKFGRMWDESLNGAVATAMKVVGAEDDVARHIGKVNDVTIESADSSNTAADAAHNYAKSLQEIISASEQMANGVLALSDAQIGYQDSLAQASAALEDNGRNLDITTEGGRKNKGALDDLAKSTWDVVDAMEAQQATTHEVQTFIQSSRDAFIQMATDMGMDAGAAAMLADKLGLIPGNYQANVEVTGFEAAYARAEALENKISAMPSQKIINLRVNTSGSGMGGHFFAASGGPASAAELGAIYRSGMPYAAAGGASGMADIVTQEQGPEITRMPNGSIVIPHGQSEAIMAGMAGGGQVNATFVVGGPTDELGRAIVNWLRNHVRNEYGGNVASALGQRAGA